MSTSGCEISVDQIKAAAKLYECHLHDWRLADTTIASLSTNNFESAEACLLKVCVLDALYNTGLRYRPGLRESISRRIYEQRKCLCKARTLEIKPDLVEKIAKSSLSATAEEGYISFASKFCHFFVSEKYPIFDSFACIVLKKLKRETTPYSSFCKSINELACSKFSARQIDRYLWLAGNYTKWKQDKTKADSSTKRSNTRKRKKKNSEPGELIRLFSQPTDVQKELLERLVPK